MSNRLLVLGWHNIDPTPGFPDPPGAGRRGFERQLALLSRLATVLPLADALDRIAAGEPLPPRAVVLTFDDGYRDNLTLGVPALARHGLPATFFLVPGFLSGTDTAWWEDLSAAFERVARAGAGAAPTLEWEGVSHPLAAEPSRHAAHDAVRRSLKTLDHGARVAEVARVTRALGVDGPGPGGVDGTRDLFLDWDGARALRAAGHDVGSHTMAHAILGREDPATQAADLARSRAELETGLDVAVDTLAYPNGSASDYSAATTAAAAGAGYRCAVTTRPGLASRTDPPYEMRRVVVTPTTDLRSVAAKGWRATLRVAAKWRR